ncbi:MAG: hypothetical protein AB1298_10485 [Bacteroidota bacterium]
MELIQIISDTLIYGGGLLVLVVLISFLLSKTKRETEETNQITAQWNTPNPISDQRNYYRDQELIRKDQIIASPQINQLERYKPKEIKIIRMPTVAKSNMQEKIRMIEEIDLKERDGNGTRYTIVNEKMKKHSSHTAKFSI